MANITKTTISQPHLSIKGQKGISLIPALITICIFTVLTSQVIVPNQIRDANEENINSLVNSAEKIEQASLAYYAKNNSWPSSIEGDLVPEYLPVFDVLTNSGSRWGIADVTIDKTNSSQYFFNNKSMANWNPSQYIHRKAFFVVAGSPRTAQAVVNKIGGHAKVERRNPWGGRFNEAIVIHIPIVAPGTTTVDDLNVGQDLTVGGNIIITGNIIKPGGSSSPLIDSSKKYDGTSDPSINAHSHSSKRFKQNIYPLDTPIESIYQLKPVSFDYKEPFTEYKTANAGNQEIGLIAEKVLPLIPEITLVKDDKVMGIDYPKLSILLLKAVQDLKKDVEILQQNNQQLQKQINGLNRDSQKVATLVDLDEMR